MGLTVVHTPQGQQEAIQRFKHSHGRLGSSSAPTAARREDEVARSTTATRRNGRNDDDKGPEPRGRSVRGTQDAHDCLGRITVCHCPDSSLDSNVNSEKQQAARLA